MKIHWTTSGVLRNSAWLGAAVFIGTIGSAPCGQASTSAPQVDQANWPPASGNLNGTQTLEQEFTPALSAVNSVELWMPPYGIFNPINPSGVTAVMNIRQGGVDGPIIASSAPVFGPPSGGNIVFSFREQIPLTPGQLYAFQPICLSGGTFFATAATAYPQGRLYFDGTFSGGYLAFVEGINVPEPSLPVLLWLGGLVLALTQRAKRGSAAKGMPNNRVESIST